MRSPTGFPRATMQRLLRALKAGGAGRPYAVVTMQRLLRVLKAGEGLAGHMQWWPEGAWRAPRCSLLGLQMGKWRTGRTGVFLGWD